MSAQCATCGAILDTRTPEAAEHVAEHPPRGSYLDRKRQRDERRARRAEREFKYLPPQY